MHDRTETRAASVPVSQHRPHAPISPSTRRKERLQRLKPSHRRALQINSRMAQRAIDSGAVNARVLGVSTRVDASEMTRGTNSLHSPDTEDYSTYSVTWTWSPPARVRTAAQLADRNSRPRYASSGITEPQPTRSTATKIRVDWTLYVCCTSRARVRGF